MESTRCPRDYVRTPSELIWNLNDIQISDVTITVDAVDYNVYQMYFPRPWIIVGFPTLNSVPAESFPAYAHSYSQLASPAIHAGLSDSFLTMFLDLAFANTHELDLSMYANNYFGPGLQGKDYRGYFTKYLSSLAFNTPEQWFNAIIQPESVMKSFCDANTAATVDIWLKEWQNTLKFLEKTMQPSFMGAPGIYTVRQSGTVFGSPDWNAQTDYETFLNL